MPLRAVLFDKDGTLLDFEKTWGPATLSVLQDLAAGNAAHYEALIVAAAIDPQTARFAVHSPIIAGSSADYGVSFAEILAIEPSIAFLSKMDRLFAHHGLASLVAIEGAVDCLAQLSTRDIAIGLATNDSEAAARQQMEVLGLAPHFSFVAGYDSGHGAKPDPGMILAFIAKSGLRPSEIALIGDSRHDLVAARSAGVMAIAVTTGLATAADLGDVADFIAPSLSQAIAAVGL